jgi:cytochrome P450
MRVDYSPYDAAVHADPYPVYARLRELAPVCRNEALDFWALSRHCDVAAAFRDARRFSNANGILIEPSAWGANAYRFQSMLAMDPPRHTQARALVAASFTRRRMAGLEPLIRRLVRGALASVLELESFDFVTDFADGVLAEVLCALIGVAEIDRTGVGRLARRAARHDEPGLDIPAASIESALALAGYYGALVAERRRQRRDDLVSELLDATVADEQFADDEVVAFLNALTGAANDTVVHLLGSAWYWAWRYPRPGAAAYAGNIGAWIEETLRYDTPTQFVARTLTEDIELHGTPIPAQARVLLLAGAANRDPSVFPSPDRYDLGRDTTRSLSFGKGRHLCLGAGLARLEARVVLEELLAHVAGYEIDEPGIRRAPAAEIRGFACLPTSVRRR